MKCLSWPLERPNKMHWSPPICMGRFSISVSEERMAPLNDSEDEFPQIRAIWLVPNVDDFAPSSFSSVKLDNAIPSFLPHNRPFSRSHSLPRNRFCAKNRRQSGSRRPLARVDRNPHIVGEKDESLALRNHHIASFDTAVPNVKPHNSPKPSLCNEIL